MRFINKFHRRRIELFNAMRGTGAKERMWIEVVSYDVAVTGGWPLQFEWSSLM